MVPTAFQSSHRIFHPFAVLSISALLIAAVGCLAAISPNRGSHRPPTARKVTYARDVASIVNGHCVMCHRAGDVGPFSLESFADVKRRAKQIAQVTANRNMPPWRAESHGEFKDDCRLTDAQIETIQRWAVDGAPLGDAGAA